MRYRARHSKAPILSSLVLAGILVLPVSLAAASTDAAVTPVGFWRGAIEVPNAAIEVMIEITNKDGGWQSIVYVPAQGIRAVDMIDVSIAGGSVKCGIPGVPGQPMFTGHLTEDGLTIVGDFKQGGQTLPFELTRSEKPSEYDEDVYAVFEEAGVAGSGVVGIWRGLLASAPHRFRLVMHLAKASDGSFEGTIDALDQNAAGLRLDGVAVDDKTLSFTLPTIGARFSGRLSDDGAEVSGQWRQSNQTLLLTFKRVAP